MSDLELPPEGYGGAAAGYTLSFYVVPPLCSPDS